MNQRPQLTVHRDLTQPAPPSFRHLTKPDTLPRSLSESVDSGNPSCVQREDMNYASNYDHFGGVRVLVWAFLFEGALVMAISARWAPTSDPLNSYVDSLESLLKAYSHRPFSGPLGYFHS